MKELVGLEQFGCRAGVANSLLSPLTLYSCVCVNTFKHRDSCFKGKKSGLTGSDI